MACAVEDAGFEIRDCLMWMYGSGFPKSHNVGKKLNKKKWQGWGTALKPAFEPIILARKPISEKSIVLNVLKWGTGVINVDVSRIKYNEFNKPIPQIEQNKRNIKGKKTMYDGQSFSKSNTKATIGGSNVGRWPANVLLNCCCDEIVRSNKIMIHTNPNCPCFILDQQSGNREAGKSNNDVQIGERSKGSIKSMRRGNLISRSDKGGASRFFYCAKANKKEKGEYNNHPTVKPLSLMKYLIKLITPKEGTIIDPFAGTFTTCIAAEDHGFKWIGCEQDRKSCKIGKRRIEDYFENDFNQKITKKGRC